MNAFLRANIMDGHQVRMVKRAKNARFILKASQTIGVEGERFGQDFNSDDTGQACITGSINFAHTSRADQGLNFVRAKFRAGAERHVGAIIRACRLAPRTAFIQDRFPRSRPAPGDHGSRRARVSSRESPYARNYRRVPWVAHRMAKVPGVLSATLTLRILPGCSSLASTGRDATLHEGICARRACTDIPRWFQSKILDHPDVTAACHSLDC